MIKLASSNEMRNELLFIKDRMITVVASKYIYINDGHLQESRVHD